MSKIFYFAFIWIAIFTSCTQQRMAFRFADTAASWKADDYFDLSSAQKEQVKKHLKLFLNEAYENNDREFPKLFDKADQLLAKVTDQEKLDCLEADKIKTEVGTIFLNIPALSANHIKTLTDSLSPKQIQYFINQVANDIKEDEQKLKDEAELHSKRLKRTQDNLKAFLGSLSDEQEKALRSHLESYPFPFAERLKNKKTTYEKLKVASVDHESFQKFILNYVQNWRNHQSAEYLKISDELHTQNERFYLKLICEASPKQLGFLRKKLGEIKRDFEEFFVPPRGI